MTHTGDGVDLVHDLRVWVNSHECGTVDLEHASSVAASAGTVRVYVDTGRTQEVAAAHLRRRHVDSDRPPRPLLRCRWLLSCSRTAVRMQPHPLMAPVPVCRHHIDTCGLG